MWASIVSAITAWEKSAKLAEQFFEAYLAWKIQKIRREHETVNTAREEVIKQINIARAQRDSAKLINLNRALFLVEYAGVQLNKDTPTDSSPVHSPRK